MTGVSIWALQDEFNRNRRILETKTYIDDKEKLRLEYRNSEIAPILAEATKKNEEQWKRAIEEDHKKHPVQHLYEKKFSATISGADLIASEITDPKDIIPQVVLEEGLTVIGGAPGEFKSYLALDICLAISTGDYFLNKTAEKHNCLYVDKEMRLRALKKRLIMLARGRELSIDQLEGIFFISDDSLTLTERRGHDTIIEDNTRRYLKELIEKHNIKVLVFDSLVRFTEGNENDTADMKLVFSVCSELMQQQKVSIILLHHTRKNSKNGTQDDLRGSGDLSGQPDYIWLSAKGNKNNSFSMVKNRHGEIPKPLLFDFIVENSGSSGESHKLVLLGEIERPKPKEIQAKEVIIESLKVSAKPYSDLVAIALTKTKCSRRIIQIALIALKEEKIITNDDKRGAPYRLINSPDSEQDEVSAMTKCNEEMPDYTKNGKSRSAKVQIPIREYRYCTNTDSCTKSCTKSLAEKNNEKGKALLHDSDYLLEEEDIEDV